MSAGTRSLPASDAPALYRVRVAGRIGREWADRFDGLQIAEVEGGAPGVTELTVPVCDQAALMGLLQQLYDSGCLLASVERVDEG